MQKPVKIGPQEDRDIGNANPITPGLIATWEMRDRYIFIMQSGNKISAEQLLNNNTICYEKKISIFKEIVRCTIQLKHRGVFHRDLKPANIILSETGEDVQLIDFGVSSSHSEDVYRGVTGTFGYMAPEVMTQQWYLAEPVTVFSLGVILFRFVNMRMPFYTQHETIHRQETWGRHHPQWVKDLGSAMMAKTPYLRPSLLEVYGTLTLNS